MVLLFCLLILTALTLLGLSAAADTRLQNQLTTNLQEQEHANQSAQAALSWAEHWLLELPGPPPASCTGPCGGLYVHAAGNLPPHPEYEELAWWQTHGYEAGIDPLSKDRLATLASGSIHPAMWVIELVHEVPPDDGSLHLQSWYRLLARGTGRTGRGISVIESIVVRPWIYDDSVDPTPADPISVCDGFEADTGCGRVSWRELR